MDGGEAQWQNSGGVGAARWSLCPEIPVQCRVGVGEEEVDGAPKSKAKLWRRLVVAEQRDHGGAGPLLQLRECGGAGLGFGGGYGGGVRRKGRRGAF